MATVEEQKKIVRQVLVDALAQLDNRLGDFGQTTHARLGSAGLPGVAADLVTCFTDPTAHAISDLSQAIRHFLKESGLQAASPPLFQITNKHVDECGTPSPLPADFETGPYYRSYFENEHGEQWLFWFNYDTKELHLRGGDCGWDQQHKVIAVAISDVAELLSNRRLKEKIGSIGLQVLLAGQHKLTQILSNTSLPLIFVLTADNKFTTFSGGEHVWLQACIMATRVEIPLTPFEEFRDLALKLAD